MRIHTSGNEAVLFLKQFPFPRWTLFWTSSVRYGHPIFDSQTLRYFVISIQ
jgi:hypothetical protein